MITKYRFRRDDTGEEYTRQCDEAHLLPRKIGDGPVKLGDQFKCVSKLDGSEYTETLISDRKKGMAPSTGVFFMKSYAMGVSPRQRVEAMKHDEKLGCKIEYAEDGDAIFRSKEQYRRYCESHGFKDRNGGYSSPRSLNDNERQNLGLPMMAHAEDGSFLEYD